MKIKDIYILNKKDSNENIKINEMISNIPENELVTKEILEMLNNNKTKIKVDSDTKSNLYIFLNDTIYISKNKKDDFNRICVIAHECIHSIQSKSAQILNFVLSNIELILFIVLIALFCFKLKFMPLLILYVLTNIFSIGIRLYLELNAVFGSIKLSDKYFKNYLEDNIRDYIVNIYKLQIKTLLIFFIIKLFLFKVIRMVITILMYIL